MNFFNNPFDILKEQMGHISFSTMKNIQFYPDSIFQIEPLLLRNKYVDLFLGYMYDGETYQIVLFPRHKRKCITFFPMQSSEDIFKEWKKITKLFYEKTSFKQIYIYLRKIFPNFLIQPLDDYEDVFYELNIAFQPLFKLQKNM